MAVLSCRVDDALKELLEKEAKKEDISLSEYIKKSLESGIESVQISNNESNLSNSQAQIKNWLKYQMK